MENVKFNNGDIVTFTTRMYGETEDISLVGSIEIIDRYGTFEQNEEPSYDILVDDFNGSPCLFKHIRQSRVNIKG